MCERHVASFACVKKWYEENNIFMWDSNFWPIAC
jgi:hypothetical protein